MTGWRKFADDIRHGGQDRDTRDIRDESPSSLPIVSIVPNVPANPTRSLKAWESGLNSLDPLAPQHGLGMGRWQSLYDDAIWLAENFAVQAAHDGWSTADLFGLWPHKPGWGGIADQLCCSRSLVMTNCRAVWSRFGVKFHSVRGGMPDLCPLWEQQS